MLYLSYLCFLASASAVLLPEPTGPFSVGVTVSALTDTTRMDPLAPADTPQERRVLISMFIPLNTTMTPCVSHPIPYMTPLVAEDYDVLASSAGLPNGTFASLETQLCDIPKGRSCSQGRNGRPTTTKTPRPLLLFSPGAGQSRLVYGAMAMSLASEGYVVVTVDHPYDASVVEFPDGSFVRAADISGDDATLEGVIQVRTADVSFVIDQLQSSPTLRQPVENSAGSIDFENIIMYGHSLGGATSAAMLLSDSRVLAGVNMDGRYFSPVTELGVDRPFLSMGRLNHSTEDSTWDSFYTNSSQAVEIAIAGTIHGSFTDYPIIISALNFTEAEQQGLHELLGEIEWTRAGEVIKALIVAFGHFVSDHTIPEIFQGGDATFPEVEVLRSEL